MEPKLYDSALVPVFHDASAQAPDSAEIRLQLVPVNVKFWLVEN